MLNGSEGCQQIESLGNPNTLITHNLKLKKNEKMNFQTRKSFVLLRYSKQECLLVHLIATNVTKSLATNLNSFITKRLNIETMFLIVEIISKEPVGLMNKNVGLHMIIQKKGITVKMKTKKLWKRCLI